MNYRKLGRSGLKVSEISIGSWITFGDSVNVRTATDLLKLAYEKGINYFDNADVYALGESEKVMGKAIKDIPRHELVISSKVFWPTQKGPNGRGLSRKHIMESVHGSLKRLDTDYLDLYFAHRYDPDTPIEEVVETMNILIQQGKILYWGTSMWKAAQIAKANGIAKERNLIGPTMEQPLYNMFSRELVEDDLLTVTENKKIGLTVFSPLAQGVLTGKYNDGVPEDSRAVSNPEFINRYLTDAHLVKTRALSALAKELGMTAAQLAIAWILRRDEVSSVITGASKVSQLESNVKAGELAGKLDEEVLVKIEEILA